MYEIDTEAEGTVAAATETNKEVDTQTTTESPAAPDSDKEPAPVAAASSAGSSSHRSPSILFLGKDGWAKRLAGIVEPAAPATPSSPTAVITVQQGEIHPMYGRPRFSEKEMEALIMGGAETAPSVISPSGGAQFAV